MCHWPQLRCLRMRFQPILEWLHYSQWKLCHKHHRSVDADSWCKRALTTLPSGTEKHYLFSKLCENMCVFKLWMRSMHGSPRSVILAMTTMCKTDYVHARHRDKPISHCQSNWILNILTLVYWTVTRGGGVFNIIQVDLQITYPEGRAEILKNYHYLYVMRRWFSST